MLACLTCLKTSLLFVILSRIYDYDRSGFFSLLVCSIVLSFFLFLSMKFLNLRLCVTQTTITLSSALSIDIFTSIENEREHIYEILFIFQNHISISMFRVFFSCLSLPLCLLVFYTRCVTAYLHHLCLCAWCRNKIDYVKRHWVNIKIVYVCKIKSVKEGMRGEIEKKEKQIATLRITPEIWIVVIMGNIKHSHFIRLLCEF